MSSDLLPAELRNMTREVWVSHSRNSVRCGRYHTEAMCFLQTLEGTGRVPTTEGWAKYAGMRLCRACSLRERSGGSLLYRRARRRKAMVGRSE